MAKINDEYDIGAAFEAIENELIASMIRNFEDHKQEELDEKKRWSMWQTEMLQSLEKYKHDNKKKYGKKFKDINQTIKILIGLAKTEGGMEQEKKILEAIAKGFPAKRITKGGTAEFFKVNDRKLEALIQATIQDMQKAETAVLRMANDQYRKIIYNAQVYANTGAGTYEKAVDMATKDFLRAGLNCIKYSNGSRHTIADYADMAIRTASKRAYLQGEGQMRQEWGLHLVIMNKRGCPCPKCLPFVGKIMIDDVWSGGSKSDGRYPLMSSAIAAGLYHPRCKDSHTTYFSGITKADPKYNKQELSNLEAQAQQEAKQQYAARQEKKFERMTDFSLDPENQQKYKAKQKEWNRQKETIEIPTSTQDRRSTARSEITDMHMRQDILEKQLESAKETEKALTQKVYFDMTGTPEEMEQLKQAQEQKKIVESSLSDLKDQILSKQETYKNEVEKQLIEDGILETVKFSRKMKPETVDELESTKELGGSLRNDWVYDINKHYSAKGKIVASSISRYAAKNPYETFAEGFLAMEKGEKIPEQIEKVIANAKKKAGVKSIAKSTASGIMKLPKYENSVIPRAKFTEYALNPAKDPNKAKAFEMALGYTTQNADHLIEQIRSNLPLYQAIEKGDRGYGMTYEVIMDITGPNGKTAKVLTAWIDDRSKGEMRLTTVHVD